MDAIGVDESILSNGTAIDGTSVGGAFVLDREKIVSFESSGTANLGADNRGVFHITFFERDVEGTLATASLIGKGTKSAHLKTYCLLGPGIYQWISGMRYFSNPISEVITTASVKSGTFDRLACDGSGDITVALRVDSARTYEVTCAFTAQLDSVPALMTVNLEITENGVKLPSTPHLSERSSGIHTIETQIAGFTFQPNKFYLVHLLTYVENGESIRSTLELK